MVWPQQTKRFNYRRQIPFVPVCCSLKRSKASRNQKYNLGFTAATFKNFSHRYKKNPPQTTSPIFRHGLHLKRSRRPHLICSIGLAAWADRIWRRWGGKHCHSGTNGQSWHGNHDYQGWSSGNGKPVRVRRGDKENEWKEKGVNLVPTWVKSVYRNVYYSHAWMQIRWSPTSLGWFWWVAHAAVRGTQDTCRSKQIYHLWCLHAPHFVPLGSWRRLNFNYECYKVVCKAFMLIRLGSIWPVQRLFKVKVIVTEVEWWIEDDASVGDEKHFSWWDGSEKVVIRSDKWKESCHMGVRLGWNEHFGHVWWWIEPLHSTIIWIANKT